MLRPLLPLLPAVALCLPALADMPAGLKLGEKEKDVLQKVSGSDDFTPLNEKARRKLEGNYSLNGKVGGQQWLAHFVFDRRSKQLTQLLFVGEKAMQPNQYNQLLKSFYVFTLPHLREHFKLKDPLNLPEFGHASSLKTEEMFPLHAFEGEGIMLTTGLWKSKAGGIHLCFSVQPATNSAMGNTYTTNTSGKQDDWVNVIDFSSTDEGRAYMEKAGMAIAATPEPEPEPEEEPSVEEDDTSLVAEVEETTEPALPVASTDLPQAEQDMLNGLILSSNGKHKEGLEKLVAAAQAGNVRALYELGCGYSTGKYGLTPNTQNADSAFTKAARGGYALALVRFGAEFPVALAQLSFMAEEGKKMLKVIEAAGESSPSGRFNHAIMLRYGYGVRKDAARALEMMQQLATEGDPEAARLAEEWAQ